MTKSLSFFNMAAAAQVGAANTFGYWFAKGPNDASPPATNVDEAYAWGRAQAVAAAAAWTTTPECRRTTIFIDVEGTSVGQNGWDANAALNQKVFEGFFNELESDPPRFKAGVYATHSQWTFNMGPGYGIPPNTPIWSADHSGQDCDSCPTSLAGLPTIGGIAPTIWQYNLDNGGGAPCPADLDCAMTLPN